MDEKINQPEQRENDMQIGSERPAEGKEYTTIREIRIGFDADSPRSVTATVATNRRTDEGVVTDRGQGRGVDLDALSPEILAAIQTLTNEFVVKLGV